MKLMKLFASVVVAATVFASFPSTAGSIGRSSSSSFSRSSSSSFSRPAPSKPAVAPSRSGGIGGTAGSMGVRKTEVTAPVAARVEQSRPSNVGSIPTTTQRYSNPAPTYGSAPTPSYSAPAPAFNGPSAGSTFLSSMGGAVAGSLIGNALFGNHGSHGGGTTVINNGGSGGGAGSSGGVPVASGPGTSFDMNGAPIQMAPAKSSYGFWNFIGDAIGFILSLVVIVAIVWALYKGFKLVKNYISKERGVAPKQPFSPTAQFWLVQNAFASGVAEQITPLLGPDLVDEATRELTATELTLSNVSHEVVLNNAREFSVHYTFNDGSIVCDQVWHYELHGGKWVLNGIENV